jgi:mRNA interferase MazF
MAVFEQGDVSVTDLALAGLPAPSLIRTAKIATIDAADATRLGKVSAASLRKVLAAIVTTGTALRTPSD